MPDTSSVLPALIPRDVMPEVAERQAMRYRQMSPSEKMALADALWDLAFEAARAGLVLRNPELTGAALDREARRQLLNASD